MTEKEKQVIRPIVVSFVEAQKARFRPHFSDAALTAVLMVNMDHPYVGGPNYLGELIADCPKRRENAAYLCGAAVFEKLIELACEFRCNGHHIAQQFAAYVVSSLEKGESA